MKITSILLIALLAMAQFTGCSKAGASANVSASASSSKLASFQKRFAELKNGGTQYQMKQLFTEVEPFKNLSYGTAEEEAYVSLSTEVYKAANPGPTAEQIRAHYSASL